MNILTHTHPKIISHMAANTLLPLKEENLYITARNGWSQSVHYKEVTLYMQVF